MEGRGGNEWNILFSVVAKVGFKKAFLYLISLSRSLNQGMVWVESDLKSHNYRLQGSAVSLQEKGLFQMCLHLFPMPWESPGNLRAPGEAKERKSSAAPQAFGPQGWCTWCVSLYQKGCLKHPNHCKVLGAADFGCSLILFLVSNSQKCNQSHPQAKSPGEFDQDLLPGSLFHTNPQIWLLPKSLLALHEHTQGYTQDWSCSSSFFLSQTAPFQSQINAHHS